MTTYGAPQDWVELFRVTSALFGISSFGILVFRLIGRWPLMSDLSRCVVLLLCMSTFTIGLGSARAHLISAPFNEFAIVGLVVNVGATVVGLIWHRLLDPTRTRT